MSDSPTDDSTRTGLPDELQAFLDRLDDLKAAGCTMLVVGDTSKQVFTQASERLFGDGDVNRYRLLALLDVPASSAAARLPDPEAMPCPLTDTTHVVTHATPPRAVTASPPSSAAKLRGVPETQVLDPELDGLQQAIFDAIDQFESRGTQLEPGDVRVGLDPLVPLLEFYDDEVVRRCLRRVGDRIRAVNGMGHFVLPDPYESERVAAVEDVVDAVLEVGEVADDRYDFQLRWHLEDVAAPTEWIPI